MLRMKTMTDSSTFRQFVPLVLVFALSVTMAGCKGMGSSNQGGGGTPPAPSIARLNPVSGVVGTAVTISGANFGATQGTSTVTFNGIAATVTSWSSTSIVAPVPVGATTGNVVVTVGGVASNGVSFMVTILAPSITSLNPTSGAAGTAGAGGGGGSLGAPGGGAG